MTEPKAPETDATDWLATDPADMSFDQLRDAKQAIQTAVNATQEQLAWQSAALMRVNGEISTRFDMNIPGLPPLANQNPYPMDKVQGYEWPGPGKLTFPS